MIDDEIATYLQALVACSINLLGTDDLNKAGGLCSLGSRDELAGHEARRFV